VFVEPAAHAGPVPGGLDSFSTFSSLPFFIILISGFNPIVLLFQLGSLEQERHLINSFSKQFVRGSSGWVAWPLFTSLIFMGPDGCCDARHHILPGHHLARKGRSGQKRGLSPLRSHSLIKQYNIS
jgi:hypothetical protein